MGGDDSLGRRTFVRPGPEASPMMDSITLGNFRCFRDKQTARLAPLTLLVGENSTGKTSFLALIRALWDVAYGQRVPDFKEEPYDLGSYREIAYSDSDTGSLPDSFLAGFERKQRHQGVRPNEETLYFETTFEKTGTRPIPIRRYFSKGTTFLEEEYDEGFVTILRLGTTNGTWQQDVPKDTELIQVRTRLSLEDHLTPLTIYLYLSFREDTPGEPVFKSLSGSPTLTEQDLDTIRILVRSYLRNRHRPFASAPVRSKPYRTYDPSRPTCDPEGDYVPMYLANLHSQDETAWQELQSKLELFGKESGLFDRILIEQLGKRDGGPFQVRIGGAGTEPTGPHRNLIDVGYGVSQALPLITEMLREDAPNQFLLQQPEVHLHPSAQAALGSLFCQVSGLERQLIVETHSDYILDRIRMDVRDGVSSLTPDDISVLFFERQGVSVRIHSVRFDEQGNVLGSPPSYRGFFMRESRRAFGL